MVLRVVLLSAGSASALIWHPKNPKNSLWDTWLFAQPGQDAVPKFYMNYLSSCDASCGGSPSRDPAGCCGWNGVGAAISSDGVHYEDQGVVVHKDADAAWLGSGSVLKNSDDEYVMNFSEEYDCQPADPKAKYGSSCQSIFFATSKDLKTWTRLAFKPPPANDTEVFKYSDGGLGGTTPGYEIGGRWDSISTVPKPGSPGIYYGFWTASPSGHGGAGVGETTDQTGHHWKALPPITDGFSSAELGSTVVLGDKYYMLFGGGHIYSSDNPIQGYKPDAKNFAFHTDGDGVAYSRLWNVQGSANESIVLITHQWMTYGMLGNGDMGSKGIYLAPIKEMKVGADGTPRAVYWSGNEKLKGDSITLPTLIPAPPAPPPPPVEQVDVASCGGGTTTWEVPAIGAAAGPIALKSSATLANPTGSACLGIENGTDALVLSKCSGAAQFAILADGSITSGHGCAIDSRAVSYKFAPGNVFATEPNHGVRQVDSPGQCCALCQSLKNCSFWTSQHTELAKPTCYDKPGGCCYLKTAAAKDAAQSAPGATSGSSDSVPYCVDAFPTLRTPSPPPEIDPVGTTRNGTCGGTNWGGDCDVKVSGAWHIASENITDLASCVARAEKCKMADYVSFSDVNGDCSWYAASECDFHHLKIYPQWPYETELLRVPAPAPPPLFETPRLAPCDSTAIAQDWTTAGGIIKQVKSGAPGLCLRTSTVPAPPAPPPLGVLFDVDVDLTVGVVIEATLSCTNASTSAGIWVHGSSDDATFVWNCATNTFTVGGKPIDRKPGFAAGAAVALKMLVRTTPNGERGMAEFYANEIMSHPFTFNVGGGKAAKIGVAADITAVTAVKAWKMTLSSDQESLPAVAV